jgi:hypothetical protein
MSIEETDEQLLSIANRIANASSHEWPHIFDDLLRRRRLSKFVRGLNRLLNEPAHRDLAKSALKRFGLDYAG